MTKKELKIEKKIDDFLYKFGRLRLSFTDYPQEPSKGVWNGVYTDIEPPQGYKDALKELISFGMKLK